MNKDVKSLLLVSVVSATHKETKQFFTLYNTLDDKKVYLEKEVSEHSSQLLAAPANMFFILMRERLLFCLQVNLLNSIHDNFQQ